MVLPVLTNQELEYEIAHINESLKISLTIGTGALLGVSILSVGLRLLARRIQGLRLSWNDCTIIFALGMATAMGVTTFYATSLGLGAHVITVGATKGYQVAEALYIFEVLFPVTNTAVKISILLLYRSIFGAARGRKFEISLYAIAACWLLLTAVLTFCIALQCVPVSYAWTTDHSEKCLDLGKTIYAPTIFSIFLNFATLILPLPIIMKLHMSKARKITVTLLFILGGGDVAISIARTLETKAITASRIDFTWIQSQSTMLGLAEPCVGIVCACIPTLRPVFMRFYGSLTSISRTPQTGQSAWTVPFILLLTGRSGMGQDSAIGLSKIFRGRSEYEKGTPLPQYSRLSPRAGRYEKDTVTTIDTTTSTTLTNGNKDPDSTRMSESEFWPEPSRKNRNDSKDLQIPMIGPNTMRTGSSRSRQGSNMGFEATSKPYECAYAAWAESRPATRKGSRDIVTPATRHNTTLIKSPVSSRSGDGSRGFMRPTTLISSPATALIWRNQEGYFVSPTLVESPASAPTWRTGNEDIASSTTDLNATIIGRSLTSTPIARTPDPTFTMDFEKSRIGVARTVDIKTPGPMNSPARAPMVSEELFSKRPATAYNVVMGRMRSPEIFNSGQLPPVNLRHHGKSLPPLPPNT